MATADIPLDKAYLLAIWLESVFYGANLMLFFIYLIIVRYKRRSSAASNYRILFAAIAMSLLSTTHISLGLFRLVEGFIYKRD
ncbi:hypothetical protein K435DRAFT_163222, partial [Dendrothele bispora CBS 962.96]